MAFLTILKLALGVIFFVMGIGYLYNARFILNVNALFRDLLFNDRFVLLRKRRAGVLLLLLSLVVFYMGFTALTRSLGRKPFPPTALELQRENIRKSFQEGKYVLTLRYCEEFLGRNPSDTFALERMTFAALAVGEKERARKTLERLLILEPSRRDWQILLDQIEEE